MDDYHTVQHLSRSLLSIGSTLTRYNDAEHGKCHESRLRSYQVLQMVKQMLVDEVPPEYILAMINVMETEIKEADHV